MQSKRVEEEQLYPKTAFKAGTISEAKLIFCVFTAEETEDSFTTEPFFFDGKCSLQKAVLLYKTSRVLQRGQVSR